MWHVLRRDGIDIGREQTARLMRLAGVSGRAKGRGPVTTRKSRRPDWRPDLVHRHFRASGSNKLWVADITYVRTKKGFVDTAFVTDVFSRRIVGWALSDSMRTKLLPLQALNQAIGPAPRKVFDNPLGCRQEVFQWCMRYNTRRRHSWCHLLAPDVFEAQNSATLIKAA